MDSVKAKLRQKNTDVAVIPGGLTSVVQPLDVCLNKPFKDKLRQKWTDWMIEGEKTYTKGGIMRAAALETVSHWVVESWNEVSDAVVERSFKKCAISNALDGIEDDMIWDDNDDDRDKTEEDDDDEESVYDDRLTGSQWNDIFGQSDTEDEFVGF